jgi:hypothetical protein
MNILIFIIIKLIKLLINFINNYIKIFKYIIYYFMEETSEMYFHKFQHDINCLSDNVKK